MLGNRRNGYKWLHFEYPRPLPVAGRGGCVISRPLVVWPAPSFPRPALRGGRLRRRYPDDAAPSRHFQRLARIHPANGAGKPCPNYTELLPSKWTSSAGSRSILKCRGGCGDLILKASCAAFFHASERNLPSAKGAFSYQPGATPQVTERREPEGQRPVPSPNPPHSKYPRVPDRSHRWCLCV